MNSQEPTVNEIRSVFRLINKCCDQWDHPDQWQSVLLQGMQEIFEFPATMLQLVRPGSEHEKPEMIPIASMGWNSHEEEQLYLSSLVDHNRPKLPNIEEVLGSTNAQGSVTCSRPMAISDDEWYQSNFFLKYVKPVGLDEWAASFRIVPHLQSVVTIGGNHKLGAAPTSIQHIKLLGILAEEIAPLLGTRLSLANQVSKAGLTPRQRQTLDLLLDGLSEKQVANQLNLSTSTVHDYIVKLHKHFDVQSRGELLSYFIKRKPKDK